jgi:hypothetical protein
VEVTSIAKALWSERLMDGQEVWRRKNEEQVACQIIYDGPESQRNPLKKDF